MPKALGPGNNDPARHAHHHNPLSQQGRGGQPPPRIGSQTPGTLFPGDRPTLPPPPGMTGGPSAHFQPGDGGNLPPAFLPAPDRMDGAPALGNRLPPILPDSGHDFGPPPASPRPAHASLSAPPPSPRPGFASLPDAGPSQPRPSMFDPVHDSLGRSHPIQSSWPDLPPTSPFTAFLPPAAPFTGIAGGGIHLPPLDFSRYAPPPPPNPRMDALNALNAQWDRDHADLPPKQTRVGFAGPGGERIPAGAQTPPAQPPPTWNGTRNTELSDMVAANYDTVHAEKRDQRRFFDDIVANPTSDTATKRRELREELDRIDRDPNSQHLGQTAREDLAQLGLRHPHLVDEGWLAPTRPSSPQSPAAG